MIHFWKKQKNQVTKTLSNSQSHKARKQWSYCQYLASVLDILTSKSKSYCFLSETSLVRQNFWLQVTSLSKASVKFTVQHFGNVISCTLLNQLCLILLRVRIRFKHGTRVCVEYFQVKMQQWQKEKRKITYSDLLEKFQRYS